MSARRYILPPAVLIACTIQLSLAHSWITTVTPRPYSITAKPDAGMTVQFSQPIDPASLVDSTVVVWAHRSGLHTRTLSYDAATQRLSIDPVINFIAGERVDVILTARIRGAGGNPIVPFMWSFEIAPAAGSGSFDMQTLQGSAPDVVEAVLHDFTGDGIVDLSVLDKNSSNRSMFMIPFPGSGWWGFQWRIWTGWSPRSAAVGELDGRPPAEYVIAKEEQEDLTVVHGEVSGSYTTITPITVGWNANRVQLEDLNGDGLSDVIANREYIDTVRIVLNGGNATFNLPAIDLYARGPSYTIAADLDLDGDLDLVVAQREANAVRLFYNNGNASFADPVEVAVGGLSAAVAAADMNSDGWPDIISVNSSTNTVSVVLNGGAAGFGKDATYESGGTGAAGLVVCDWDADGDPDIAVVNRASGSIAIFRNAGNGTLSRQALIPIGKTPNDWFAIDWDLDGDLDLITLNDLTTEVTLLSNRSGEPRISVDKATVAFGGTVPDTTRTSRLKVRNAGGTKDLIVHVAPPADGRFTATPDSLRIAPDDSATIMVKFTSAAIQFYEGTLVLTHNDPSQGSMSIPLSGYGVAVRTAVPHDVCTWQAGTVPFTITFAEPMNPSTFTEKNIVVNGTRSGRHRLTNMVQGADAATVSFDIVGQLMLEETVTITATTGLRTARGTAIVMPWSWSFKMNAPAGSGVFGAARRLAELVIPMEINAGDLDNDGDADLTVHGLDENTLYYLTCTDTGWVLLGGAGSVGAASMGDLAGVGGVGVTWGDWTNATCMWWEWNPATDNLEQHFRILGPVRTFPTSSLTCDIDGNGTLDVAYCEQWEHGMEVFRNDGAMGFTVSSIPVDGGPRNAASADFDGDGLMDFVVATAGRDAVAFVRNFGNNVFDVVARPYTGAVPVPLAVADFNNDGRPDVAVGAYGANMVSLLINDGDFLFHRIPLAVSGAPRGLVAADFDGDGHTDLAALLDQTFVVWRNNGTGSFSQIVERTVGAVARGIQTVDFGQNGSTDLLVTADGYLLLFENKKRMPDITIPEPQVTFPNVAIGSTRTSGFTVENTGGEGGLRVSAMPNANPAFTLSSYTLDVFHGGSQRVVVSFTPNAPREFRDSILVYSNAPDHPVLIVPVHGTGQPVRSVDPPQHGRIARSGDSVRISFMTPVAADGVPPDAIRVTSTYRTFAPGIVAAGLTTNGSDLLLTRLPALSAGEQVTVTVTPGVRLGPQAQPSSPFTWSFRASPERGTPLLSEGLPVSSAVPRSPIFLDCDRDGDLDLAFAAQEQGEVFIMTNDGTGAFTLTQRVSPTPNCVSLVAADFDRDGDLDIAIGQQAFANRVAILINDGTGQYTSGPSVWIPGLQAELFAADYDADGDTDILFLSNGVVTVLENDGTGAFTLRSTSLALPSISAVVDFDNDGLPDICSCDFTNGTIRVASNEGNGTFVLRHTSRPCMGGRPLSAADFDGDGRCDIAFGAMLADLREGVMFLRNAGEWEFPATAFSPMQDIPYVMTSADLDGDGDPDLAMTSLDYSYMATALNDGHGVFTTHQTMPVGSEPSEVVPADVDNDGDLDLLIGAWAAPRMSLFWNMLVTSVHPETPVAPAEFSLAQNYPNPFNPSTNITFTLPIASRVRLEIYNTIGQRVERLRDEQMAAGIHTVRWEARVPAGIYWCRFQATGVSDMSQHFERTMKMVLIK